MLANIFAIIINTVTGFFAGVLLLRFWMQAVRVRPPQQVGAFVFQLSNWLVMPLRKVLPGLGGYDWSSLMGAFLISLFASLCDDFLRGYLFMPDTLMVVWHLLRSAFTGLLLWMIYGLIGLLLLGAILSWVNPYAPMAPFITALSNPILRPIRRIVPLIGNIDLSPLVALIVLQILLMVVRGI